MKKKEESKAAKRVLEQVCMHAEWYKRHELIWIVLQCNKLGWGGMKDGVIYF
jgi:hypothetical protein